MKIISEFKNLQAKFLVGKLYSSPYVISVSTRINYENAGRLASAVIGDGRIPTIIEMEQYLVDIQETHKIGYWDGEALASENPDGSTTVNPGYFGKPYVINVTLKALMDLIIYTARFNEELNNENGKFKLLRGEIMSLKENQQVTYDPKTKTINMYKAEI